MTIHDYDVLPGQDNDDVNSKLEKLHAPFIKNRMQALADLPPDRLRGIFQMLLPTMQEVAEDNESSGRENSFEEVLARYALNGIEDLELDLYNKSDDPLDP